MSSFLYVVYAPPATPEIVDAELHRFVVGRCSGRVLNNALQQYRFNITTQEQDVSVEPFLDSASFSALMRDRRKRRILGTFLEAMFDWAASRHFDVHLLTVTSRPRQQDAIVRFGSIEQFRESLES